MESRLSLSGQYPLTHTIKRWSAIEGNDTSQGSTLSPAVKSPHYSFEYSAQNAWNWNHNNQAWDNNNKNNTNSLCAVRDYVGSEESGIVTLQDLYTAYEDCRHRKKNKKGAKAFDPYTFHILSCLCDEINGRRYRLKPSQCFVIKYPVPREVFCAAFRDRVVQHFVYNELNPVLERMLIRDTASCRIGKGTDYAIRRAQTFVRRETDNYKQIDNVYYAKLDISGFFMSIDRQLLLKKVLWVVDNKYYGRYKAVLHYLLPIIILSDVTKDAVRLSPLSDWDLLPPHKTLFGNDHGLPIGNITSQLFANFYLNDMDHLVKSRHKSFVRYVDDMVIVDTDRNKLIETRQLIMDELSKVNMRLNIRKSIIKNIRYGVQFLGIAIKPYYSVLSGKRIGRLWYTSRNFKDANNAYTSCSSRRGMFERYHGRHLSMRWYESLPDEVKGYLKMDSDAKFYLVGKQALPDKHILQSICLYTGRQGENECCTTSTKTAS